MRECYRPYTKVVAMIDGAPVTVDLHDTAGNLVKCNYVTVTSVSGGDTGVIFSVTPSGLNNVSLSPTDGNNNASALVGITSTSGIAGLVVFSLNNYDTISHVIISQAVDDKTAFAVTYGAVVLANPRADDSLANLNLGT